MSLFNFLGVAAATLFTAYSPKVNFHFDNRFNAIQYESGGVSYTNTDGDISIELTFDNTDNIWHYENYVASITLVGQYSYATFFLDSVYQFRYDGLLDKIDDFELQLQEEYLFGFADLYHKDVDAGTSFIHRTYFVNPSTLGYGSYTIEDVSWSNIRAYYPNAQTGIFGRWLTYQDFLYALTMMWSDQNDNTIWNRDTYNECYVEWTTDLSFTFYDISYVGAIEPQIHYSDTKVCVGNSNGYCDVNSTRLSYLPYSYMIFNVDNSSMFPLDDANTQIRFKFYLDNSDTDSFRSGYEQGYFDGRTQGNEEGYEQGLENGYDSGYSEGFSAGYSDADLQDETAVAIFTGIIDVGLIPINFFLAMLNFEVFGINISGFVASLLTVAIVVIIIRIVTGNKNDD